MKRLFQVFAFTCTLIIAFSFLLRDSSAFPPIPIELAQASESTTQRILDVALPESAIVRLREGTSYAGQLMAFNSVELTLSANEVSQPILLSDVRQIEFQGDVWLFNPDGVSRRGKIRGLTQTLVGVPVTALSLEDTTSLGYLNLSTVLSQEEYERLSDDSEIIHAIREILFENQENMSVKIAAIRR